MAKRQRAKVHLEAVRSLIDQYTRPPYALRTEAEGAAGRYTVYSTDRRVLPAEDIATAVGDCVHNMRSVFDYIAWELAGGDLADRETMFPLRDTEGYWKRTRWRLGKIANAEARTHIEKFQPFHAPQPHMTAQWLIEHLDVADKHKLLTVTSPITDEVLFKIENQPPGDYEVSIQIPPPETKCAFGSLLAIATITPPVPAAEVTPTYVPQVVFANDGQMPPLTGVIPNLDVMMRSVDNVIAEFSRSF